MKPTGLDCTGGKPSRDIARIKEKLKQKQIRDARQYNSLCYDLVEESGNCVLTQQKNRKSSKKDLKCPSPGRLVRSKSRNIEKAQHKLQGEFKIKPDLGSLYGELMAVKSEYKKLKGSYQRLAQQKLELTSRGLIQQSQKKNNCQEIAHELDRYRKNAQTLECQLQRIKKECMRIVETEKFKNKKLEQIIQQKDLMISFLRRELDRQKKGNQSTWSTANQSAIVLYQNVSQIGFASTNTSNIIIEGSRHSKEEDSLCFSRDYSKQMESVSSLLANNEPHLAKKQCVVIEPKMHNQPNTQPEECLTFEQREQQAIQLKQSLKMPPRVIKKQRSKPKTCKPAKRFHILTQGDQNRDANSRCGDSIQQKLFSAYGSKAKKKMNSSRKKI